jgi:hypothetical protein
LGDGGGFWGWSCARLTKDPESKAGVRGRPAWKRGRSECGQFCGGGALSLVFARSGAEVGRSHEARRNCSALRSRPGGSILQDMKMLCLALLLILVSNSLAQSTNTVAIDYEHAGLTRLVLHPAGPGVDGKLSLTWHTMRKSDGAVTTRQDMSSYDRHELDAWLTSSELSAFRQWAETNRFGRFQSPFPTKPGPATYGSAFETSLTVDANGSRRTLKWSGDSILPRELESAVSELVRLGDEVKKERK